MRNNGSAFFHKVHRQSKPRVVYYRKDFLDYVLMVGVTALVIGLSYGFGHPMSNAGLALCGFMVAMFVIRHGVELNIPLIIRRPQEVLYTLAYKLQNLKPVYFVAVGVLLLENVLIADTPNLPHHVELMRKVFV